MSLWRQFARGTRRLLNREAADRDLVDEVQNYLDEAAADLRARGHSPEEVRRELGNSSALQEQVRDYGWESVVAALLQDIRYAARRLRKSPGFTAATVLTLALGIGSSAAIFSVLEGVLWKPLPYPHAEQLVALWHTAPGIHIKDLNLSVSLYYTYREENRVFQNVGMWTPDAWTVTGQAEPEQVTGLSATHDLLSTLGVQTTLGRTFTTADEDPASQRVVLLSDGYWKTHFGGDRSVLGRSLLLDGNAYTVAGVLPPSFRFLDRPVSLIAPLRFNRAAVRLISFCCQGVARLKPGVTLAQADADVARMLALAPEKFPMNSGFNATMFRDARIAPALVPLKDFLVGLIAGTLWVLMGTVGILLSIACANVANLLLVRADARRQELAVRAALGARWTRIARELLLESLLLGCTGGALGLALADLAVRWIAASGIQNLPRIGEISLDPAVLAFTLAVSLAAGMLFGLIPAVPYSRPHLSSPLRGGGRSLTSNRERHRARGLLVVIQVALALVLMVGSGLMLRTFQALRRVDPGFSSPREVETASIAIPSSQVREPTRVIRLEEDILGKMETVAGVSAVGICSSLPMSGGANNPLYVEGQNTHPGVMPPIRRYKFVSPGYVETIGSRLIAGRDFTWEELDRQASVALVSDNMAREIWHDPNAALGKRIRSTLQDDWREIVGVVADLSDDGVNRPAPAIVYWPLLLKNFDSNPAAVTRSAVYLVRTPRAGTSALLRDLQRAVAVVNPSLPLASVDTLQAVYERSLSRTSLTLLMLAVAGGMSLLLGLVGIYGVISYSVAQQRREIGIRLALGATLADVTARFVRRGLALSAIGAVLGLTAAFALTRLMKSLLFEVSPADPFTYFAASAALIIAAALASYLPARRATAVDPAETLRAE